MTKSHNSLEPAMRSWLSDERGQASLEWVMLMTAFGLPMVFVYSRLLDILAELYRMITFLHGLPLP